MSSLASRLRPTSGTNEARFGLGAWLTLMVAAVALFGQVAVTLVGVGRPTDGWAHASGQTRQYSLVLNAADAPSDLREGDIIVAVNGEPLIFGYRTALPATIQVGDTLRYTVQRDEQVLEIDVPLVSHSPVTVVNYVVRSTQKDVASTLIALVTLLVVGFAFARRPGNEAARLLVIIFAFFAGGIWFGFANWDPFIYAYPPALAVTALLHNYGWTWLFFPALTHLVMAFPRPVPPLRRFPRLLPCLLYGLPASLIALTILLALDGKPESGTIDFALEAAVVLLFVVTTVVCLAYNFLTVREPVARAQLHWIALGLGVGWGLGVAINFLGVLVPDLAWITEQLFGFLIILLPLSLVVAINRYHLFDIDVIVNRALVYGTLTGTLLLIYFGGVVLLQGLFRSLTGQGSNLAIVASTLAIAALFQPLRRRIQAFIDRRFYRRKYDATLVLAAHGAVARNEVNIDLLSTALLRAVDETMRPAYASLWLRQPAAR